MFLTTDQCKGMEQDCIKPFTTFHQRGNLRPLSILRVLCYLTEKSLGAGLSSRLVCQGSDSIAYTKLQYNQCIQDFTESLHRTEIFQYNTNGSPNALQPIVRTPNIFKDAPPAVGFGEFIRSKDFATRGLLPPPCHTSAEIGCVFCLFA